MRFALAALVSATALCASILIAEPRSPVVHAQPVGIPLSTIIEFGDPYNGGDELYDAKITVVKIARGAPAWEALKSASPANQPPKEGFQYLLVQVRFAFSARTTPSHYSYTIDETQFSASDTDGNAYAPPALARPPQPRLRGTLAPGDSIEGWVAFLVPRMDPSPLMLFQEDVGSVIHRGGGVWFQLSESIKARSKPKVGQENPSTSETPR
ncbi:MAG TPA: DUF4352 domain-containing protein [Candidatus Acidoferrales bacterium]|nr:DUF4352 domain-containing protein [Candidatus Acidoferrales bacterium]